MASVSGVIGEYRLKQGLHAIEVHTEEKACYEQTSGNPYMLSGDARLRPWAGEDAWKWKGGGIGDVLQRLFQQMRCFFGRTNTRLDIAIEESLQQTMHP